MKELVFAICIALIALPVELKSQSSKVKREYNSDQEVFLTPDMNLGQAFRKISQSTSIQRIVFTPGNYIVTDTLFLPRNRSLVIVEGQGANLKCNKNIPIFYSLPVNQSESMIFTKTRYLIQNFGKIQGGSKGVFLGASFNTVIRNIEFIGQKEAAIDLVFCLMSTIEEVLVTNVEHDGIVLRSAVDSETKKNEWPGTSFNNSQCNHSVLKSCRVYNKKGCTGTSFKVLQSTGVRLEDCISEGWANRRAVFFDAQKCTTAKLFKIQNFHLEHLPIEGAICLRGNGSIVEIDGLFLQHGEPESPAIWIMSNSNYTFKNIPWWPERAWVKSTHSPSIVITQCTYKFYDMKRWKNNDKPGQPIYPNYIRTSDKLIR